MKQKIEGGEKTNFTKELLNNLGQVNKGLLSVKLAEKRILTAYAKSISQTRASERQRCVELYENVIDKSNDYTFALAERDMAHKFSPSGLCYEKSPEEGLTIKQYIEKYLDPKIKNFHEEEDKAYAELAKHNLEQMK